MLIVYGTIIQQSGLERVKKYTTYPWVVYRYVPAWCRMSSRRERAWSSTALILESGQDWIRSQNHQNMRIVLSHLSPSMPSITKHHESRTHGYHLVSNRVILFFPQSSKSEPVKISWIGIVPLGILFIFYSEQTKMKGYLQHRGVSHSQGQ